MPTQFIYTLTFSDPTKNPIQVIGTGNNGSGINNYDTSLDLVGPGYILYGQSLQQNFVKLLESFAGPNPPQHSIEGQLWYDTSDPDRNILRVNNGNQSSDRWPAASGIYQQATDPSTQYIQSVTEGDIWVDTQNNQLKIRYGTEWTVVGPTTSASANKTGSENVILESSTGNFYPVILNWVDGQVVEIISYYAFTPRSVINGFGEIKVGLNLTSKSGAVLNGLASRASALEISRGVTVSAADVLRSRIGSTSRQIHTGTFIVESPQGFAVRRNNSSPEIKFIVEPTQASISFTATAQTFKLGIEDRSFISFNGQYRKVGINTTASLLTGASRTLTVNGGASFLGTITVSVASTQTAVEVLGRLNVTGVMSTTQSLLVGDSINVTNTLTTKNIVANTSTAVIGTASTPFEQIYVSRIGQTGTSVYIYGEVESAQKLTTQRSFKIEGVITSTNVLFNGTASVVLTATTNAALITGTTYTTSTTATLSLLVVNTGTVSQSMEHISKNHFLTDSREYSFTTGMIVPWTTSTVPAIYKQDGQPSWLLCNGQSTTTAAQLALFNVIGYSYGGAGASFDVPNVSTALTTGTFYYLIKT
ncbi:MAG: tail fiber protein [Proteobacteria bacterium]|nr:tail fiber protein [Pseudomonadota bacterium]NBP13723.1 tail fiber protein [bacterium]